MKVTPFRLASGLGALALIMGIAVLLSSHNQVQSRQLPTIKIDGSSTVYPITNLVASEFNASPLFIYVNLQSAQNKPEVQNFVEFYLNKAPKLVSSVGYIPLSDEGYHLANVHFNRGKVGTVFGGEAQLNLTLGELLRKQATF